MVLTGAFCVPNMSLITRQVKDKQDEQEILIHILNDLTNLTNGLNGISVSTSVNSSLPRQSMIYSMGVLRSPCHVITPRNKVWLNRDGSYVANPTYVPLGSVVLSRLCSGRAEIANNSDRLYVFTCWLLDRTRVSSLYWSAERKRQS